MLIKIADSIEDYKRCFPLMLQLHPHLNMESFLQQIQRQYKEGHYKIAYIENSNEIRIVAGFRISETLAKGKYLYIDDFVTDKSVHYNGYGKKLLAWLIEYAKSNECVQLDLDCAIFRKDAPRFYFRNGLSITRFHFDIKF